VISDSWHSVDSYHSFRGTCYLHLQGRLCLYLEDGRRRFFWAFTITYYFTWCCNL